MAFCVKVKAAIHEIESPGNFNSNIIELDVLVDADCDIVRYQDRIKVLWLPSCIPSITTGPCVISNCFDLCLGRKFQRSHQDYEQTVEWLHKVKICAYNYSSIIPFCPVRAKNDPFLVYIDYK